MKLSNAIGEAVRNFNNNSGAKIEKIRYDGYEDKIVFDFIEMTSSKPAIVLLNDSVPIAFNEATEKLKKALDNDSLA